MSEIGLDADAVRTIAAHLDLAAHDAQSALSRVDRLVRELDAAWSGGDALDFHDQWHRGVAVSAHTACRSLTDMADALRRNVAQQDVASGVTGAVTAQRQAESNQLATARDLPNLAMSLKAIESNHQDFAIQKVLGPDGQVRYIVLLTGINRAVGSPNGHDLPYATYEELAHSSMYERQIEAAMNAYGVPPGADVALIGHSQGGIAAMNLSRDPAFRARYHLTNVVTLGSPIQEQWDHISRSDPVNYLQVRDPLDVVSTAGDANVLLQGGAVATAVRTVADPLLPRSGDRTVLVDVGPNDSNPLAAIPLGRHPIAHGAENYSAILSNNAQVGPVADFASSMQRYNGSVIESMPYHYSPYLKTDTSD